MLSLPTLTYLEGIRVWLWQLLTSESFAETTRDPLSSPLCLGEVDVITRCQPSLGLVFSLKMMTTAPDSLNFYSK